MSEKLQLIIGNKNYSSWSLRPWLLLKYFQIPFEEILIHLYEGDYKTKILQYSSSGKVPILIHGSVKIWESLAICEYLADLFPEKKMWPEKLEERAWARSISQEMHAGFVQLRTKMPMNLRGHYPKKGHIPEVEKDISRILQIWSECREHFKSEGPFLFGNFTIADAMFAPVVTRFKTYEVELKETLAWYTKTILNLSEFQEWLKAGVQEPWFIAASEIYNPQYQPQS